MAILLNPLDVLERRLMRYTPAELMSRDRKFGDALMHTNGARSKLVSYKTRHANSFSLRNLKSGPY